MAALHQGLMQVAGFAIAAGGFWRIGRYLGGWEDHEGEGKIAPVAMSSASLVSLGLAGGLVPCWDAVGLVVLSSGSRSTGGRGLARDRLRSRHGRRAGWRGFAGSPLEVGDALVWCQVVGVAAWSAQRTDPGGDRVGLFLGWLILHRLIDGRR